MAEDGACDGCGAMLPAPDADGLAHCSSCGRINRFEVPRAEAPPSAGSGFRIDIGADGVSISGGGAAGDSDIPPSTWIPTAEPWIPTTEPRRDGRAGGERPAAAGARHARRRSPAAFLVGLIVVLGILAGVGGAGFGLYKALSSGTGPLSPTRAASQLFPSDGTAFVVPGSASGRDVVVMVTDNGDGSSRKLARVIVGGKGDGIRWKSAALPGDAYTVAMASDGKVLYAGAGDEVRALDLATGEQRWKAKLSDKISAGCPSCFSMVGGALIVRTDDAYLTAFVGGSDEPRWTRRLRSLSARPSVVDGKLLLIDDPEDSADRTVIEHLDPTSGKVAGTARPFCPENDGEPYQPFDVDLDPGTQVVAVPGTHDAVAVFGSGYPCAARWEISSGTVRWAVPGTGHSPSNDDAPLVTATDLVVGTGEGVIVRYDLATGRASAMEAITDATAEPEVIVGGTVIGATTASRGTARGGLAAWDLASGRRLWSHRAPADAEPVSEGPYRNSDALFEGSPRFALVSGTTLRVFVFDGDDRSVATEVLDAATGETSATSTRKLLSRYESGGTPSLTIEARTPTGLLVSIDSLLQLVPYDPDAKLLRWPPS